jgi:dipeptidyl aminopeptidase/acylaminoacyl peptidase
MTCSRYPYLDPSRLGALGASYGGYMINWINGHTNRFRCLVNHDGIFSLRSLFYTTEEIWFPGDL